MLLEFLLQETLDALVKGEDDINPVKLCVNVHGDVADVLSAAAECGEYTFLMNKTKHYNIIFNDQILVRDDLIKNYIIQPQIAHY